jgi:hypothetical protein
MKKCLLVVDDDLAMGKVIGMKLKLPGYDVITTPAALKL